MMKILEEVYKKSINSKKFKLSDELINCLNILIENIDCNKSLVSALVTSLLKKITDPSQDVRYHRIDFKKGYSARTLDTRITTPFFKRHFPKYANKETAFLTLATRERIPWTLKEGNGIKVRNKEVKKSFLIIFDSIEKGVNPSEILSYLFQKLYKLANQQQYIYNDALNETDLTAILNINTILEMLKKHFAMPKSSRLPVIAIYSVYQEIFKQVKKIR